MKLATAILLIIFGACLVYKTIQKYHVRPFMDASGVGISFVFQ